MTSRGRCTLSKLLVILGTRPEIVKLAPLINELDRRNISYQLAHTGQHYDFELSELFIDQLGLNSPEIKIQMKARTSGEQVGEALSKLSTIIRRDAYSLIVVEGDTNSTLAGALAANKNKIPLAHVEAGLRSYDLRMPEEYNRRIVDHISTLLFAPTQRNVETLRAEKIPGSVYRVGNTVLDCIEQHWSEIERMPTSPRNEFILGTIHRQENTDSPKVLAEFFDAFRKAPLPVVLPLHPRTKLRLKQFGLLNRLIRSENVELLKPVGYFELLSLMKNCSCVMTDSGGIQEEATSPRIRRRVVVMRLTTERQEAVSAGFAKIGGCESKKILKCLHWALDDYETLPHRSPFGDGRSSRRIGEIIDGFLD